MRDSSIFLTGSVTLTRVPCPNSLSMLMAPFMRCTHCWTMGRPRPTPGWFSADAKRWKGSKMRCRSSGAMPQPVSRTDSARRPDPSSVLGAM
ncbi:hypothetical protein D3C87_2027650 [compost metagenome]